MQRALSREHPNLEEGFLRHAFLVHCRCQERFLHALNSRIAGHPVECGFLPGLMHLTPASCFFISMPRIGHSHSMFAFR